MRPISVALAIGDAGLREDLRGELARYPVRLVLDQGHIETFQLMRLGVDLILIDTRTAGETLQQLIQRVRLVSPRTGVVVVSRRPDPQIIVDCLHAGAREFVLPPIEDNLRATVERAIALAAVRESATPRMTGNVIGFVSAKGGCGATSIACHVALSLERGAGSDVLLADFDMETGLVGFLMQPQTPFSIVDALRNVHRLDGGFWRRQVGSVRPHLDVLPSPLTTVRAEDAKQEDFRQVFRLMRSMYGWVVTDLGRGLNRISTTLLEDLDELFLVTTPQVGAVFQARQFIQRLVEWGYPRTRLHVVLNRAVRKGQASELRREIGAPAYAEILDRPELEQSYAEGRLLAAQGPLGAQFEALAAKIAGLQQPVEKPKSWSLFGFRRSAPQEASLS